MHKLAEGVLEGSRRALARLLTEVENGTGQDALTDLYPHTGETHLVGVTGAPGTGKSSLVNQLALYYRQEEEMTVGVVAVDPTSPFSGGAILGDRIRMRDLAGDPGVFIRSMASRGSLGGLARATADVSRVLDAFGFDVVIIETVGAGQSEVDIAKLAQTTIVVEAPGLGDDVQALKAGILEIADILVVNKADDPRSKNTVRALRAMLDLGDGRPAMVHHHGKLMKAAALPTEKSPGWDIPIWQTNALDGSGIANVVGAINAHHSYLEASGELLHRERSRAATELEIQLREVLLARLLAHTDDDDLAAMLDSIADREILPRAAAEALADHVTV